MAPWATHFGEHKGGIKGVAHFAVLDGLDGCRAAPVHALDVGRAEEESQA